MPSLPPFTAGRNIALKVPAAKYAATIAFYRDTLHFPVLGEGSNTVRFEFGPMELWVDRVADTDHSDLWLELRVNNLDSAKAALKAAGVQRCDEIEELPPGFPGCWVRSPSDTVHLVYEDDEVGEN
jgi:catechol 2,3-dioxygenase-like lactoylglutathione lyase family enzyme